MSDTKIEKIDESASVELYVVGEDLPTFPTTGCLRFDFQRGCVNASKGFVINAGCGEDPAELQEIFGERVINVDINWRDGAMRRNNRVNKIMDLTKPWDQFANDSAELVVFGDVLEQFTTEQAILALREARRVAKTVCITAMQDHRRDDYQEMTEGRLRYLLKKSDWYPFIFMHVDWGFECDPPVWGHCVEASRAGLG
jgi:hypothetical protein